ncbi:hypothetical protein [Rothia terrae]|uniref:hypothetical protein n=1 Tax=Rothia terrae TaxID=396015 RepID=UPI002881A60B|nr:hypothetical protein [Rothia terrae]MDT0189356.1 hypothetical protein [Rothia terrae]
MRTKLILLIAILLSVASVFPAYSAPSNSGVKARAHGSTTNLQGSSAGEQAVLGYEYAKKKGGADSAATYVPEKDPYQYAFSETCQQQSANCNLKKCEKGGNEGVLLNLLYADADADVKGAGEHIDYNNAKEMKGWSRGGTFCSAILDGAGEDGPAKQLTVVFTADDFNKLDVLPSTLNGPVNGHTLKNYNTNLWAVPQEQRFTTQINGRNVDVIATPSRFAFTYGDGQTLDSTNPGYALGEDQWDVPTPTTHVYTQTGDYQASVTTVYTGRYSVEGGPWLPVNGVNEVASAPQTIQVWRTEAGLVDANCSAQQDAWGCAGWDGK